MKQNVIIYAYHETPDAMYNFNYFIEFGLDLDPNNIYVVCIYSNPKYYISIPQQNNLFIIQSSESKTKLDAYRYVIQNLESICNVSFSEKTKYIFVSDNVIGPFLPSYYTKNWTAVMTDEWSLKVPIVTTRPELTTKPDSGIIQFQSINWDCFCIGHHDQLSFLIKNSPDKWEEMLTSLCLENTNIEHPVQYLTFQHHDLVSSTEKEVVYTEGNYPNLNANPKHEDPTNDLFVRLTPSNRDSVSGCVAGLLRDKHHHDYFYAVYGTINRHINITHILLKKFFIKEKLIFRPEDNCNNNFGDILPLVEKSIIIKKKNKLYTIMENYRSIFELDLDPELLNYKYATIPQVVTPIMIVYFIYTIPGINWKYIVSYQLTQLVKSGLLTISKLHIHIASIDKDCLEETIRMVKDFLPTESDYTIQTSTKNEYEYRGIQWIHTLAQEHPERIFLYFHSKGMTAPNLDKINDSKKLFQEVIVPWKKVLHIFHTKKKVNKVGFAGSDKGFMWFNFWWARGTYLATCETPAITDDRFYYEYWLGYKNNGTKSNHIDCFSLPVNDQLMYAAGMAAYKLFFVPLKEKL